MDRQNYDRIAYFESISQFDAGERGTVADRDVPGRQLVGVDGETAAAFTDKQVADVARVGADDMTTRPWEARRQTEDLIILRAQDVLTLPAVHSRSDGSCLLVDVKQYILAAQVGRVDELEAQLTRRTNADVRYVPVPITADAHDNTYICYENTFF